MFVNLTGEQAGCVFRENSFMWTCLVGHGVGLHQGCSELYQDVSCGRRCQKPYGVRLSGVIRE